MKQGYFLCISLAFATALLAYGIKEKFNFKKNPMHSSAVMRPVIGCSPNWQVLEKWLSETDIPPIPGAGTYAWKISTQNDSAQFYFNQGITMYYSFHIIESMASFKKATRFDPGSAMLYWAQALAYGPNINDIGYASSPEALAAIAKANELTRKGNISEKEKMLIHAQSTRYSPDSTESREKLNQVYVDNMKLVYNKYMQDADVAALYADALMLQHPWDLWKIDGTPKPWTPHIREVLEKLLAKTPNHPGANHYYIHVMEPSPYAAKAIPSANRLGKLTPGLAHTVHMPSHIYLRTGNYAKGVSVNEDAVNSYKRSIPLFEPVTGNAFLYIMHNLHMQTNNAMMEGRAAYSVISARETSNSIPDDYLIMEGPLASYFQNLHQTPIIVDVRFGNWNHLLQYPLPERNLSYSNVIYRFGRGMALANQSRLAEAKHELGELRQVLKDSSLSLPFTPFSPAIDGATVAENILAGTIALKEMNYSKAIECFKVAVSTEENMVYNEPRDWMLNAKHFLGDAYLKSGQPTSARMILEKDLAYNNENGWALTGIWQAYIAENNKTEAAKVLKRFQKAFKNSDNKLDGPVF